MRTTIIGAGKWFTFASLLISASVVHAQATRTWVSGVGDDVNPCSRTAPCKTFAGAISKTAAGGEISVLDPGGYGTVTITKSITLSGDGTMAGVLSSGGVNAIVVANTVPGDVVILRNLSINGAGTTPGLNAIRFLGAGALHVENVKIYGFSQWGIDFHPNDTSRLFVSDTSIRDSGAGAIFVNPIPPAIGTAAITRVQMEGNFRGIAVYDSSNVTVSDSTIAGSGQNGVVGYGTAYWVDLAIRNSTVANNAGSGIRSIMFSRVRLSNVLVTGNNIGLDAALGGSITSFVNNNVYGNVTDGAPTATASEM